MQPRIGFVGAGKVGNVLARLWNQTGFEISAVASRNVMDAEVLAHAVNAKTVSSAVEVVEGSDLTVLAVNDDSIEIVAARLASASFDLNGKGVIHTSGSKSAEALTGLSNRGVITGSLHPIFPFAELDTSLEQMHGTTFAVEAEDVQLRSWLLALVDALGGQVINVNEEKKALYHAALVFASNYTIVLFDIAERLLIGMDASPMAVHRALLALFEGNVANLRQHSTADALTGPLVRGDTGTITAHLDALAEFPHLQNLYKQLAEATYPILKERGLDSHLLIKLNHLLENVDKHSSKDNECD